MLDGGARTAPLGTNVNSAVSLDLVFFGGEYDNTTGGGTYLADALKANGLHVYFMGGDGIFDPAFIKGSSNGGVLTGYASNIGPNPAVYPPAKSYLTAAAKMFPGVPVSSYDVESYDAAKAIIAAYAKAVKSGQVKIGQTMTISTRSIIAKLVGQTKNFRGASGTFSFDANGDTTNRIVSIYKVTGSGKNASWTYVGLAPSM
jgi:branched-chain amino acid transport system substrate-binding protein